MRMELIKKKGKVKQARPKELTDLEKIQKAIQVLLNSDKVDRVGKEHKSLILESVAVLQHTKVPLEHSKKNIYGYPMYSHNCEAKFKIHREYNPQPNGDWGSHKFVDLRAKIGFSDVNDSQIANYQDVKIKNHEYIKPRR